MAVNKSYQFSDTKVLADLEARHASGKLNSYQVSIVNFVHPDDFAKFNSIPPKGATLDVSVIVDEYDQGWEYTSASYNYRVRLYWRQVSTKGWELEESIESMTGM